MPKMRPILKRYGFGAIRMGARCPRCDPLLRMYGFCVTIMGSRCPRCDPYVNAWIPRDQNAGEMPKM